MAKTNKDIHTTEVSNKPSSSKTLRHSGITWIDIENPTAEDLEKLTKEYAFHPLHVEASLREGSLPQQERETKYLFLLLHIPLYDKTQHKTIASQVAMFMGKNFLITLHSDAVADVRKLFDLCEHDAAERDTHFRTSAGYLLYSVVKSLLNDISAQVFKIFRELDQTEDAVFDPAHPDAVTIAALRQKILKLRRTTGPLKTVMADLASSVHDLTKTNLSHHYRDLVRTANWLSEIADEAKEIVEIYKDADFTASSERTNEILAVLTIVFTLAIPATVLGTFYGMNVQLPGGVATGAWSFFGPYTTLILILLASLTPGGLMYWYFKKKHWF